MNYGVTHVIAGDRYSKTTYGGIRPVIWISGEKTESSKGEELPNYEKYIGEWECVSDIGHPDGVMVRYGTEMVFSDKGIDCTDLFGGDDSWSYTENLKYYNDNGNDYYVDFTGSPIGFYYDKSEKHMIIFTPSSNYPSDDPLEWNSRMEFERE